MASALTFAYKGRDAGGKLVKGRIDATTEGAVANRLRTMGISPLSISETSGGTGLQMEISLGAFRPSVGLKDLAIMTRQMSTMITAGLSLLRTLTILPEQGAETHSGVGHSRSRVRCIAVGRDGQAQPGVSPDHAQPYPRR